MILLPRGNIHNKKARQEFVSGARDVSFHGFLSPKPRAKRKIRGWAGALALLGLYIIYTLDKNRVRHLYFESSSIESFRDSFEKLMTPTAWRGGGLMRFYDFLSQIDTVFKTQGEVPICELFNSLSSSRERCFKQILSFLFGIKQIEEKIKSSENYMIKNC